MRIHSNSSTLFALRELGNSNRTLADHAEKISSGKRIVNGDDDAAGLSISSRFQAMVRGNEKSMQAINDAVSLLKNADSGFAMIQDSIHRMRELMIKANNGTYDVTQKTYIQDQIEKISQEINHVTEGVYYNGINLLNGGGTQVIDPARTITIHTGAQYNDRDDIILSNINLGTLGIENLDALTDPEAEIQRLDAALEIAMSERARFSSAAAAFERKQDYLSSINIMHVQTTSRIEDVDMARELSEHTKQRLKTEISMNALKEANNAGGRILEILRSE